MIRLFMEDDLSEQMVILPDEKKTHYLLHVMRCREGDDLLLFNGRDGEYKAEISFSGKKKIELIIKEKTRNQIDESPLILCPAIIKKENMDLVLQKATELGVTKIIPIITQRTVVRNFNLDRAKTIVSEASEQSERLTCPEVLDPVSLKDLFYHLPKEAKIFFLSERGVSDEKQDNKNILPYFLVGPEGGFSDEEVKFLSAQKQVFSLHLGNTILRAETASIAVLSCWQYRVF